MKQLLKSRADYSHELAAFGSCYDSGVKLSYNESESREEGGTGEVWLLTTDQFQHSRESFSNRTRALSRFVSIVRLHSHSSLS